MHQHSLSCLLALITFVPASASPLYYTPFSRDNNQIRSTRTTTCLSDYFGGCCAIDEYGSYGSCIQSNAFPFKLSPSPPHHSILHSHSHSHSQYYFLYPPHRQNLTKETPPGTNATLLESNVAWPGMPTTQTANEWACTTSANGTRIGAGCCSWSWTDIGTTYPNGVVLPTLQKSMACTASNAGLSKAKRMEDSGGVMKRGWGDVWSFW